MIYIYTILAFNFFRDQWTQVLGCGVHVCAVICRESGVVS